MLVVSSLAFSLVTQSTLSRQCEYESYTEKNEVIFYLLRSSSPHTRYSPSHSKLSHHAVPVQREFTVNWKRHVSLSAPLSLLQAVCISSQFMSFNYSIDEAESTLVDPPAVVVSIASQRRINWLGAASNRASGSSVICLTGEYQLIVFSSRSTIVLFTFILCTVDTVYCVSTHALHS